MSEELDRSVGGDNDVWMLFERLTSDGCPLVVLARTGNQLVEEALHDEIVTLVDCNADLALVNDLGMPQQTDRLYPIEEALARELYAFDIGAYHVASITGDGRRRIVLTHATPLDFAPILETLSAEGYSLQAAQADDRKALIELVTPTAIDRQLSGDMGVISNLEKHGDDGCAPRKTEFWFYGERNGLDALTTELGPWGYSVERWLTDPEGVVLASEMPVDFETFREITPVLVGTAERLGVTYDGWETFFLGPQAADALITEGPKAKSLLSKLFGAKKS